MKTILLVVTATFTLLTSTAQYTQNFEGTESSLTGNCWTLTNVHTTNTVAHVISGAGSMYTDPPTTLSPTKDIITPALNITSTSFTVSFKYKLSNSLNGVATRVIQVGLVDPAGNFNSLATINLANNTPTTVFDFNQTFTLSTTGVRKLAIRTGGANGSGNSRLVFDDLSTNASPLYGTGTCNSAPVAANDVYNGIIGTPIAGNVMLNDSDPNGESMTASVVATSTDGVVVMNQNGSFIFTPNPGFVGAVATYTYQLTDNGFDPVTSNIGLVTINYASPISLPVRLVSFSAILNNDIVDLKWITASEKNVSHFEIEKSFDGKNYEKAGIVFANGNTSETINYAFTDNNIDINQAAVIYYRLRSVDQDGSNELSIVRSIRITKKAEKGISIAAYPNPVTTELRITIPSNWQGKKVSYELYNNNGQVVAKNIAETSSQTEALNVNSLAPGFYIAKISCNGEVAKQKIIKQ